MEPTITTLAERPELLDAAWDLKDTWAEFMRNDPTGYAYFGRVPETFPEYVLVGTDASGAVVVRGFSVPFALHAPGRGALPPRGWDQVLHWAFADRRAGREPDTVTALEIVVSEDRQGTGLSGRMVAAMRANAGARGFTELVAPVRPNAKHLEQRTPMTEYAYRVRPDGLPHDPWLRVHVRVGGVIDSVCPASMTIAGSLAEWRAWTGLPFDEDGWVEVPGGLTPVHVRTEADCAVYVEPNVWVRHAAR
ncbi:N-acetyltransferase [Streptomyces sp. NPDC051940]|uniref:N-acetyltransferase n=1 Tax=Streptomyces sp. NPDC051940 TaxID=3155675 RepID=UPI00341DC725